MGSMTIGHLSAGLFASMLLLEALSAAPAEAMSMEEDGCRNDRTPAIAIVYCTRLIQSSQHAGAELAWAYANRGWAYGGEGKDDLAMADFATALRLKPDEDLAFFRRGDLYMSDGKVEQAFADYSAALRVKPADPDYLNSACWALIALRRGQEALADCDKSLDIRPGDAYTLDSRGYANLLAGNATAAIADFDHALKLDPRLASSLFGRGKAKERNGDKAGAAGTTTRRAQSTAISRQSWRSSAYCRCDAGHRDGGMSWQGRGCHCGPGSVPACCWLC